MTLLKELIEDASVRKLKKIADRLGDEIAEWVKKRDEIEVEIEKLTESADLINREIASRTDKKNTVPQLKTTKPEESMIPPEAEEPMVPTEEEEEDFEEPKLRVTDDEEPLGEEPPVEQEPSDERAALWQMWEELKAHLSDHQEGAVRAMTRVHRIRKSNIKIEKLRAVIDAARKILNKQATVRR